MQSAMLASVLLWTLLAAVVIGLAIYRKVVSRGEMDIVHFREAEAALISGQENLARRMDKIDHWGKLLTILAVLYGLLIAVVYLLGEWQKSTTLGG